MPGSSAADSTEIYQEGLRIPVLKLYERGRANETLFELIRINVRIPDVVLGDLQAQLAACRIGERGVSELARRYGIQGLERHFDELLAYQAPLRIERYELVPDSERANTAWLAFSRNRSARISSGDIASTGVRHLSSNAFIVRLSITPASDIPSAVSCTAASTSLLYPLAIAVHLANRPTRQHRFKVGLAQREHFVCQIPQRFELPAPQVLPVALREPVDEERPFAPAEEHERTEPAGSALPRPRDSLLDDSAAEVGIDLTTPGPLYRVAPGLIRDPLAAGETREGFGLERAQSEPRERFPSYRVI